MLKITYLILVHRYPKQVRRLIQRLYTEHTAFLIHVDRRVDIALFQQELRDINTVRFIVSRHVSKWGSGGIADAFLSGFREILSSDFKTDYVIVLSGQDYPLRSNEQIQQFFTLNLGKNFVYYFPMPGVSEYRGEWNDRINRYHFTFRGESYIYPPYTVPTTVKGWIKHVLFALYFFRKRVHPKYLKPYGGSTWSMLTVEAARYIVKFLDDHPDFMEFHKHSVCSDEMVQSTILLNSPPVIRDTIVNKDLRYCDWTPRPREPCPATLTSTYFPILVASDALFARKFDETVDSKILDLIDFHLCPAQEKYRKNSSSCDSP